MKIKSSILNRLYRKFGAGQGSSPMESGCDAQFFRLSKTLGFKSFEYVHEAVRTHEMQRRAYEAGWAPAIGHFRVFNTVHTYYGKQTRYGYVTEIAELLSKRHPGKGWWSDFWEKDVNTNSIDFEEYGFPNFLKMSEAIGIEGHDYHAFNVGWVGEKHVCIDFSQCHFCDDTDTDALMAQHRLKLRESEEEF
jgi:hypothetical protein